MLSSKISSYSSHTVYYIFGSNVKLMSRCSRHAWVDEMGICTVTYVTHCYATNSKAIASYTQTVTQLDTKQAFLKIA